MKLFEYKNFTKLCIALHVLSPFLIHAADDTEKALRTALKLTQPIDQHTKVNALQELLIKAQRGHKQNSELIRDVNWIAQVYAETDEKKLDDLCNPNYSPVVHYTALQLSAFAGFDEVFKILLAYGANPHIPWNDEQFDEESQRLKVFTHDLENLIETRGLKVSSVDSINEQAARSMLAALSARRWSLFWSCKTPQERAKLLSITLPEISHKSPDNAPQK